MAAKKIDGLMVISFKSAGLWEDWLEENHKQTDGVWLRLQKKGSQQESPTYAEALDAALCYGWIDGMKRAYDESSWVQKFTRRRTQSSWSKNNTKNALRLIREGRMRPPGLAEVEAAKKDGRWKRAYDSPKNSVIPKDFLERLSKDKKALEFFKSLNKANLFAISYRLQTAKKAETREKRIVSILETLKSGKEILKTRDK